MEKDNNDTQGTPSAMPGDLVQPQITDQTELQVEANTPNPAITTLADMEKMQKKRSLKQSWKKLTIVFLVAVMLVLGGYLAWQNFKPDGLQNDLNDAITKFIKMEKVGGEIELNGFGDIPLVSNFQVDSSVPALGFFIEVKVPAENFGGTADATMAFDFRGVDDKWYIRVQGLDEILSLILAFSDADLGEDLDQTLSDILGTLDNEWLYFTTEILKSATATFSSQEEADEIPEIGINEVMKPGDFVKLSELYMKHPFVIAVSSQEDGSAGVGYLKVELGFDEVAGQAFMDEFYRTTFESEAWNKAIASAEKTEKLEADSETFSVWMKDGEIVRIPFSASGDIFVSLSYGESAVVEIPQDATALGVELLSSLFLGLIGETYSSQQ